MAVLYLTEQGAKVARKGNRLVVSKGEQELLSYPIHKLKRVVVQGRVNISVPLLLTLFEYEIDVVLMSATGSYRGSLGGRMPANASLRLAQFRAYEDHEYRLAMAKQFVKAKIRQMRGCLQAYKRNYADAPFEEACRKFQRIEVQADRAPNLQNLLGIEGGASKEYFAAFPAMLRVPHPFAGRNRRPPQDWVNSLLSLGYTFLFVEASSRVEAVLLDPYVGFLHEVRYGRKSLALDLCEEFRHSLIDPMVIRIINLKILTEKDFTSGSEGVKLNKEGFKKFVEEFENRLGKKALKKANGKNLSWGELLEAQASEMRNAIEEKRLYRPFDQRNDW